MSVWTLIITFIFTLDFVAENVCSLVLLTLVLGCKVLNTNSVKKKLSSFN